MITELVTFIGNQGHRHAQVLFLATCIAAPYAVDFFLEEFCSETRFFNSEEEAEEAAKLFAFEGVMK